MKLKDSKLEKAMETLIIRNIQREIEGLVYNPG
jgi:hypothetical protein